MIERGQVCWIDLGTPSGSEPAGSRPIVIVQSDSYNRSMIGTVVGVILTPNLRLETLPGNVLLPKEATGLPRDSVANVTGIVTIDKNSCGETAGFVPAYLMREIDAGLRLLLDL